MTGTTPSPNYTNPGAYRATGTPGQQGLGANQEIDYNDPTTWGAAGTSAVTDDPYNYGEGGIDYNDPTTWGAAGVGTGDTLDSGGLYDPYSDF